MRNFGVRVQDWLSRIRSDQHLDRNKPSPERTVFILLGGAARGAAQAGVLTVLFEQGITPDAIVGISAGAWNGAYLALAPSQDRCMALEGLWIATTSQEVMSPHRWAIALNAVTNRPALFGNEGMRRMAERHLKGATFEDARIRLSIVASDLASGNAYVFETGSLVQAIMASSAVPGIFPPVIQDDVFLVDGGLSEWASCEKAMELGATRVVLVACGGVQSNMERPEGLRLILQQSFEFANRMSFRQTVAAMRGLGLDVLPIYPELHAGTALNFDVAPALVHAGRIAATRAIREWRDAHDSPRMVNDSMSR